MTTTEPTMTDKREDDVTAHPHVMGISYRPAPVTYQYKAEDAPHILQIFDRITNAETIRSS
jgi:hypothetical protein